MTVDEIDRELEAIKRRRERDSERHRVLHETRRALRVRAMIGVPNGIVMTTIGFRIPWQTIGTVKSVRRTRATVDFGSYGSNWDMPIDSLQPVADWEAMKAPKAVKP